MRRCDPCRELLVRSSRNRGGRFKMTDLLDAIGRPRQQRREGDHRGDEEQRAAQRQTLRGRRRQWKSVLRYPRGPFPGGVGRNDLRDRDDSFSARRVRERLASRNWGRPLRRGEGDRRSVRRVWLGPPSRLLGGARVDRDPRLGEGHCDRTRRIDRCGHCCSLRGPSFPTAGPSWRGRRQPPSPPRSRTRPDPRII